MLSTNKQTLQVKFTNKSTIIALLKKAITASSFATTSKSGLG
jgi:hypothetical protein